MFIGKPMQTIASREPDRQAIITKTATFLAMGGEIQQFGTIVRADAHKQLGEVGTKNKERAKKALGSKKFHI